MVAEDAVLRFGYAGLFVVCFLASTIVPLGSEVAVAMMPGLGFDVAVVFLVATAGNVLGACLNYAAGRWGRAAIGVWLAGRIPTAGERTEHLLRRWGPPALALSWMPLVGDALTVAAGALRVNPVSFTLWVLLGKGGRYAAVLGLAALVTGSA
jgi:membrane protein YqaA with SNARE-associated domain